MIRETRLTTVAVLVVTSCTDPWADPEAPSSSLQVLLAARQPQSPDLGVVVEVQARGGNFVSLAINNGSLQVLSNGVVQSTGACMAIGMEPLSFVVIPTEAEATLFTNLYQLDEAPNGGRSAACNTLTEPLRTNVTPIQAPASNSALNVDAGNGSMDAGIDGGRDAASDGGPDAAADGGS